MRHDEFTPAVSSTSLEEEETRLADDTEPCQQVGQDHTQDKSDDDGDDDDGGDDEIPDASLGGIIFLCLLIIEAFSITYLFDRSNGNNNTLCFAHLAFVLFFHYSYLMHQSLSYPILSVGSVLGNRSGLRLRVSCTRDILNIPVYASSIHSFSCVNEFLHDTTEITFNDEKYNAELDVECVNSC